MKKYFEILRLGWLDALEYRTEFMISIMSWGIRLFIAFFLWVAVAQTRGGEIGPYTTRSILVYFFITQIISSFVFSRVGFDIAYDIYRGDLANFLLKPMNYIVFRVIHETGKNIFRTILGAVIFGTLLWLWLGGVPFALWKIPFVLLALPGAYIVNFCMVALISLTGFWTTNSTRYSFIYFGILSIFSGMVFPVDLFPDNFAKILKLLPFQYVFFYPAKIIQSQTFSADMWSGLFIQLTYALVFGCAVAAVYCAGLRKFEADGR